MSDEFSHKWEKVLKKLGADFMDSAQSKSNEDLAKQILRSQTVVSDLEKDMENDVKLNAIKDDLKKVSGAYRDEINLELAKSKYCLWLLRSRGKDTT
jgi:hypothetical protein